jgi:acetoin utilization protein AcuC
VDPATPVPDGWRDHVVHRLGRQAPMRMTDGRNAVFRDWSQGYDPNSWLDRAVHATRTAVFPLHGLDPMP